MYLCRPYTKYKVYFTLNRSKQEQDLHLYSTDHFEQYKKASMNEVQDHYERIGHDYDRLCNYMDSYADEQTADIIKCLELEKTCISADIGGGTG